MGCGGLSVMEGTGTLGMPLWCAGSFATNMKVSIQTHNFHFHEARIMFILVVFIVFIKSLWIHRQQCVDGESRFYSV